MAKDRSANGWSASSHWGKGGFGISYASPWRELLPDGSLGPSYKPVSARSGQAVAYEQAVKDHAEGRYIGSAGLWDHQEAARMSPKRLVPPKPLKYDHQEMDAFVKRHGSDLTVREIEVWTFYWKQNLSLPATARAIGVSANATHQRVKQLRLKMRKGS